MWGHWAAFNIFDDGGGGFVEKRVTYKPPTVRR